MTELKQQNVQNLIDTAIARKRYRDNEIPCSAIEKDPDGGLKCTPRGLAQSAPALWFGYDGVGGVPLAFAFDDVNLDVEEFNNDATVFVLSANEVAVLKSGDVEIEARVTVETRGLGTFGFEIAISEDPGDGHARLVTTISAGSGRGELS